MSALRREYKMNSEQGIQPNRKRLVMAIKSTSSFGISRRRFCVMAGGAIAAYELSGLSDLELLDCEFPHITQSKRDEVRSFKDTVIKDALNSFTHTDNSESPALVKTVRLLARSRTVETTFRLLMRK